MNSSMQSFRNPSRDTRGASPALSFYRARTAEQEEVLSRARREYGRISNLRLVTFLLGTALPVGLVYSGRLVPAGIAACLGLAAFLILMGRHNRIARRLVVAGHLRDVNARGAARVEGDWKDFPDQGEEFPAEDHAYAADLDLFGRASLFQWICCAETRSGRARLARWLLDPPSDGEDIVVRQGMVGELADRVEWRQSFQAAGKEVVRAKEDPEALLGWAEGGSPITFSGPAVLALRVWGMAGPLAVLALFLLAPFPLAPLLPLVINGMVFSRFQGRAKSLILSLAAQGKNLETYRALLSLLETARFAGSGLAAAAARLEENGRTASARIKELQTIADGLDIRHNPLLHGLLNAAFLWDLQWLAGFQRWKSGNGRALRTWIGCIAEVEALASLSVVRFENPLWCFPGFQPAATARFEAVELGHPLLPAGTGVRNDFRLGVSERAVVLTGSNMTGKSTLLRSVGLNLVLAYAGAPVCAARLETGLFRVRTSMRLKDDLDKGVSSFYAELLRIRGILEACRRGERVLFLIDEIFRGTNSVDRIAGAMELLVQLVRLEAIGVVSTHDLELGRLEELHPAKFRNYHFAESFADGKISFDFRLRPGLSRTRNAWHLMRLAGLTEAGVPEADPAGWDGP